MNNRSPNDPASPHPLVNEPPDSVVLPITVTVPDPAAGQIGTVAGEQTATLAGEQIGSMPPQELLRTDSGEVDTRPAASAGLPKIVKFAALARCGDEIWIENDGQIYRLRKTRQGKLILTK